MLDNPKQVNAFRELNKSGFTPATSVTLATAVSDQSKDKADSLLALLLPGIAYPASISAPIGQIKEVARTLESAESSGRGFVAAFAAYQSPSELITVNIGWDCYLKGESKPAGSAPALVTALADTVIVKAMSNAVTKVNPQPVIKVMNDINKILNIPPPAGGANASTALPAPTLSDELVKRLITACGDMKNATSGLTGAYEAVSKLTADGVTSVALAAKAFKNAVGIAVLDSMGMRSPMHGAITAITPTSVINALFGEK
ncbi:hypothetical protein AI2795V1_4733 (plasmid) [Serratia marcescens]|uniref:hypothetical protein n=1 Tax=Serratia marcescens TaxID=615 RepID=UPI001D5222E4|nr:hypothetical protein [Serratia marcescens]CAE7798305.1 hypothetical protein AI2795V1_4733 [Serratia marcescens]CAH3931908.1 hypothetical protein AI2795V1_4733 [Serratia marcescens]